VEISTYVHENKIMILEIKGEVDAYTAQVLDKTLVDILDQGYTRIVLDVSNMRFIASAGIRTILYAYREAVQLGGEVRLTGPSDQIRRIFEIAGLFELLKITDGLQESINNWS
jgi:stage II sporulation protein AA (anti-sigma F factor antagonist)